MGKKKRILFIGGSPCSGKSTIAERIARDYGAYYFKVDDCLDELIVEAAKKGYPSCKKALEMSPDETWMREALVQCEEEFHIYEEIAEFLFRRLSEIDKAFIVTEGAAYIPNVMIKHKPVEYISIIPTADFQISHYKEREWVSHVLEGCRDKAETFNNWMQRDILFAERVKQECSEYKITCIVNDGCRNYDEMFDIVRKPFHL